eukprot:363132-Chlamydomonas_euryale.AAC.19
MHEVLPLGSHAQELRNICNHPFLSRLHVQNSEFGLPDGNLPAFISLSGKMDMLDRTLMKLHEQHHKVLLFCTMTRMLDQVEELLDWRGYKHVRLDGNTATADRGKIVADFNTPDSNIFMFLLSMRAGGVGLNLQAADTVIFYDSDWCGHNTGI